MVVERLIKGCTDALHCTGAGQRMAVRLSMSMRLKEIRVRFEQRDVVGSDQGQGEGAICQIPA